VNKAFVKEPEPEEPRCPAPDGCGQLGVPVSRRTLEEKLTAESAAAYSESSCWCPTVGCPIAYFDRWGHTTRVDQLTALPWPKDPQGTVCACLGVAPEALRLDAEAGRRELVKEILAAAEDPAARCKTESVTGRSCVTEVRRLFMEHFKPS